MILSKKLTQVLYIGAAALTLANLPASVKAGIRLIRQVNPAGTGYASFNPASGVNSLSSVPAPTTTFIAQLIIETISGSPSVDLGSDFVVAATTGGTVDRLVATFPTGPNGVTAPVSMKIATAAQAGNYIVDTSLPAQGVTNLVYSKGGTVITVSPTQPVALAQGDTLVVTGQTAAGTEGFLALIKQ